MPGGAHTPAPVRWSPRERDVLDLVARGLTNAEIATELGITFATAKWHVSELITKLGVESREEVAAYWRRERSPVGRSRSWLRGLLGLGAIKLAAGSAAVAGLASVAIVGTVILGGAQANSESTETPTPVASSPTPVAPGMIDTFAPEIGKPAPDFALPDVNDPWVLHRLSDYRGNAVVVAFFASPASCEGCPQQLSLLQQILKTGDRFTQVLAITPERDRQDVAAMLYGLAAVVVGTSDWQGQVADHYQVSATPEYLFIGPDGVLQDRLPGVRVEEEFQPALYHVGVRVQRIKPGPTVVDGPGARPATCPGSAIVGTDGLLCSWRNFPNLVAGDKGGCDLSGGAYGGNLTDIDFRGCRLDGAQFAGAALVHSRLDGVSAVGASFVGSQVGNVRFMGANLQGANFHGAFLEGADLSDANLTGADVEMAALAGVVWNNTICPDGTNSDSHGNTCLGTPGVSQRPDPRWGPARY